MTLAPGLIVLLYRRRWDIEKCFDSFKNKPHETKSWAGGVTAKAAQANFLCLTHNLMVIYENHLSAEHAIINKAETERRAGRLEKRTAAAGKAGRKIPSIIYGVQRLTQRGVKFIRWLRHFLWRSHPLEEIYPVLRKLYASL